MLQAFYSVRSERQLSSNLLFRSFTGPRDHAPVRAAIAIGAAARGDRGIAAGDAQGAADALQHLLAQQA